MCKFYQGSEDKKLEDMLKTLFTKVYRDKPDSSRSVGLPSPRWALPWQLWIMVVRWLTRFECVNEQESKEAYFVALNRRGGVILEDIPV